MLIRQGFYVSAGWHSIDTLSAHVSRGTEYFNEAQQWASVRTMLYLICSHVYVTTRILHSNRLEFSSSSLRIYP